MEVTVVWFLLHNNIHALMLHHCVNTEMSAIAAHCMVCCQQQFPGSILYPALPLFIFKQ